MIKLYEINPSRSSRCRWLLTELEVPIEAVDIEKLEPTEYLKIHPLNKVPALQDGDFVMFESIAICNYLSEKFPNKNMIPSSGTRQRAKYDQWMLFIATEVEGPVWEGEGHIWRFPEDQKNESRKMLAYQHFKQAASVLDQEIVDKDYLIENKFSTADIVLAHTMYWANMRNLIGEFKNLARHLESMGDRPHFPFK